MRDNVPLHLEDVSKIKSHHFYDGIVSRPNPMKQIAAKHLFSYYYIVKNINLFNSATGMR
jgi:patatin-like phospholipase/acyl hydrolase